MKVLMLILAALLDVVPAGKAVLRQLQPRDSILIADQVEYGFQLDGVPAGTALALPDFTKVSNDTLTLVRGWQLDTLSTQRARKGGAALHSIRGSIILAPFEEGHYRLPEIPVLRAREGADPDTLLFEALEMDVKTMPVDTATFEVHDLKGQMTYPLTFKELLPWIGGVLLLAGLIALAVWLVRRRRAGAEALKPKDPAYIVALRELDKWRGEKFWAPDKQKAYYSGITDTLKTYIEDRYGIDAPEMTTAELFDALRKAEDLPEDLREQTREVFECADFVKFAKHVASDEENARALPAAVRFVTSTYQTVLEEEQQPQA
ncbi:MAG: hypothetical protein IJ603_07780 [Bacteroidales bacterium]|nr:hypothetical protein [Bacteroidales bacterium]MBR1578729.1 hypothetical protein [Bacteroidales bacterium]